MKIRYFKSTIQSSMYSQSTGATETGLVIIHPEYICGDEDFPKEGKFSHIATTSSTGNPNSHHPRLEIVSPEDYFISWKG